MERRFQWSIGINNTCGRANAENPNGFSILRFPESRGGDSLRQDFVMLRLRAFGITAFIHWYFEIPDPDPDYSPPFKCDLCGRVSTFDYNFFRVCDQCTGDSNDQT